MHTKPESERMGKDIHASDSKKRSWFAIITADEIDFQSKTVTKHKGCCIITKGPINQKILQLQICRHQTQSTYLYLYIYILLLLYI